MDRSVRQGHDSVRWDYRSEEGSGRKQICVIDRSITPDVVTWTGLLGSCISAGLRVVLQALQHVCVFYFLAFPGLGHSLALHS